MIDRFPRPGVTKQLLGVVAFIAVLTFCCISQAAAQTATFRTGDKVQLTVGTRTRDAEVVTVAVDGNIKVKLLDSPVQLTVPADRLTMVKSAAPAVASPSAGVAPATGSAAVGSQPTAPAANNPFRPAATPTRAWTDVTGKYTTVAEFVSLQGDVLTLKDTQGRLIRLLLDKLDAASQQAARELAGVKSPSVANSPDPITARSELPPPDIYRIGAKVQAKLHDFSWKDATIIDLDGAKFVVKYDALPDGFNESVRRDQIRARSATDRDDKRPFGSSSRFASDDKEAEVELPTPPVTPTDTSQAKLLSSDSIPSSWSLKPDTPPAPPAQFRPVTISLPIGERNGGGSIYDTQGLFFARTDVPRVLACKQSRKSYSSVGISRIQLCDIASGEASTVMELPFGDCEVTDFGPNAQSLLTGGNSKHVGPQRVDVWSLAEITPRHVVSFEPYVESNSFWKDVPWARLLDENHVLTINRDGRLIQWEIPSAKAVWGMQLPSYSITGNIAISPGRRHLVISIRSGLFFLDAYSGAMLGHLPKAMAGKLFYSPDGRQLAIYNGDRHVQVWDLEQGKLRGDITLTAQSLGRELAWVDDNFLIIGGVSLIDIRNRVALWTYAGLNSTSKFAVTGHANRVWSVQPFDKHWIMSPYKLPHDAARRMSDNLVGYDQMVVSPGDTCCLRVNTGGEDSAIAASMRSRLEAAGLIVQDKAPLEIVATIANGDTIQKSYRESSFYSPFRNQGNIQQLTYTEKYSRIEYRKNGAIVYQIAVKVGDPGTLYLRDQGETAQAAMNKATQANTSIFTSGFLPAFVPKYDTYGSSNISSLGIMDEARNDF